MLRKGGRTLQKINNKPLSVIDDAAGALVDALPGGKKKVKGKGTGKGTGKKPPKKNRGRDSYSVKDKPKTTDEKEQAVAERAFNPNEQEALEDLIALGLTEQEAQEALNTVKEMRESGEAEELGLSDPEPDNPLEEPELEEGEELPAEEDPDLEIPSLDEVVEGSSEDEESADSDDETSQGTDTEAQEDVGSPEDSDAEPAATWQLLYNGDLTPDETRNRLLSLGYDDEQVTDQILEFTEQYPGTDEDVQSSYQRFRSGVILRRKFGSDMKSPRFSPLTSAQKRIMRMSKGIVRSSRGAHDTYANEVRQSFYDFIMSIPSIDKKPGKLHDVTMDSVKDKKGAKGFDDHLSLYYPWRSPQLGTALSVELHVMNDIDDREGTLYVNDEATSEVLLSGFPVADCLDFDSNEEDAVNEAVQTALDTLLGNRNRVKEFTDISQLEAFYKAGKLHPDRLVQILKEQFKLESEEAVEYIDMWGRGRYTPSKVA